MEGSISESPRLTVHKIHLTGFEAGIPSRLHTWWSRLLQANSNMRITYSNVVRAYLSKELEEDRVPQMYPAEVEAISIPCIPIGTREKVSVKLDCK